jgi:hypothetical protein
MRTLGDFFYRVSELNFQISRTVLRRRLRTCKTYEIADGIFWPSATKAEGDKSEMFLYIKDGILSSILTRVDIHIPIKKDAASRAIRWYSSVARESRRIREKRERFQYDCMRKILDELVLIFSAYDHSYLTNLSKLLDEDLELLFDFQKVWEFVVEAICVMASANYIDEIYLRRFGVVLNREIIKNHRKSLKWHFSKPSSYSKMLSGLREAEEKLGGGSW